MKILKNIVPQVKSDFSDLKDCLVVKLQLLRFEKFWATELCLL